MWLKTIKNAGNGLVNTNMLLGIDTLYNKEFESYDIVGYTKCTYRNDKSNTVILYSSQDKKLTDEAFEEIAAALHNGKTFKDLDDFKTIQDMRCSI